jgi:hypothetical protein
MLACTMFATAQVTGDVNTARPLPFVQDVETPPDSPAAKPSSPIVPRAEASPRDDAVAHAKSESRPARAPKFEVDHVFFDQTAEGVVWALGKSYKASFSPTGATYIPFLGSRAPTNFPVTFRLKSVTAGGRPIVFDAAATAGHDGTRVTFDRGCLVERYATNLDSVEQEFSLDNAPSAGDLSLEIDVETTLAAVETADGLRWANELGAVSYTRAVVVDAVGNRTPVLTQHRAGAIEIRVPATVLEHAAYPIVIDPVIGTFTVDSSVNDDLNPDIAYDLAAMQYQVVWERVFSLTDHDCYSQLQDVNGVTVAGSTVAIDFTTESWMRPRTANNRSFTQFLVAAEVTDSAGGPSMIMGRTRFAGSNVTGAQFFISPAIVGDQIHVSVGGDPNSVGPTYYCVTWEHVVTPGLDSDIFAQLVTPTSALFGPLLPIDVSPGTLDENPSVSRSDGNPPALGQCWTIVWNRQFAPNDHDIRGAQVTSGGGIKHPSFSIDFTNSDDVLPSASSVIDGPGLDRNYLVVYQRFIGPDNDIQGTLLNATSVLNTADLSSLNAFAPQDQVEPSADSDGAFFCVTHSEQFAGPDYDIYASTYNATPVTIAELEGHQVVANTVDPERMPRITALHSSGATDSCYGIVWSDQFAANDHDVYGGLYCSGLTLPFCFPASGAIIPCPCGNMGVAGHGCENSASTGGARLITTGLSQLPPDTLVLTQSGELPSSLSIFLQGNVTLAMGVVFGDGVRCVGGSLLRLYVHNAVGGTVFAPNMMLGDPPVSVRSAMLGDPLVPGDIRYYQVYYRDPANFCTVATFNVGNAMQVAWAP